MGIADAHDLARYKGRAGRLPERETVLPCRRVAAVTRRLLASGPCAFVVARGRTFPSPEQADAVNVHSQHLSACRWTVARRGFVPITVARPQRIFTVFRFSSQYLDKLIYNSGHGVKCRQAKNGGGPLLSLRAECC